MTESTTERAAEAVARYLQFWNTPPGDEQRRVGRSVFTDDVDHHAPVGVMVGVDALVAFAEQFAQEVGTYEFRPRTEPDALAGRARLAWELVHRGGSFAEGTDILVTHHDGRIASVTTFLDRAPAGFAAHDHG